MDIPLQRTTKTKARRNTAQTFPNRVPMFESPAHSWEHPGPHAPEGLKSNAEALMLESHPGHLGKWHKVIQTNIQGHIAVTLERSRIHNLKSLLEIRC